MEGMPVYLGEPVEKTIVSMVPGRVLGLGRTATTSTFGVLHQGFEYSLVRLAGRHALLQGFNGARTGNTGFALSRCWQVDLLIRCDFRLQLVVRHARSSDFF